MSRYVDRAYLWAPALETGHDVRYDGQELHSAGAWVLPDKLRADGIVSKWDEKHNRPVRDGSTWVEREVDKIPEAEFKGLRREQVLRRLEAYLKQGMGQPNALVRLRESLQPTTGPANDGPLAILARDD